MTNAIGMDCSEILLTAMCLIHIVVLSQRRSRWQGLLVGIAAAIKLTPALFIIYFLVRRQWWAAVLSTGVGLACWLLSALIRWQDTWYYVENLIVFKTNSQIGGDGLRAANQSLYGAIHRIADGGIASITYVALAGAIVVIGMVLAKRCGEAGIHWPQRR